MAPIVSFEKEVNNSEFKCHGRMRSSDIHLYVDILSLIRLNVTIYVYDYCRHGLLWTSMGLGSPWNKGKCVGVSTSLHVSQMRKTWLV